MHLDPGAPAWVTEWGSHDPSCNMQNGYRSGKTAGTCTERSDRRPADACVRCDHSDENETENSSIIMENKASSGAGDVFFQFLEINGKPILIHTLQLFQEHEEIDKIYLNFSDPWPKDRHAKRRLTSREFLTRYDKIDIYFILRRMVYAN